MNKMKTTEKFWVPGTSKQQERKHRDVNQAKQPSMSRLGPAVHGTSGGSSSYTKHLESASCVRGVIALDEETSSKAKEKRWQSSTRTHAHTHRDTHTHTDTPIEAHRANNLIRRLVSVPADRVAHVTYFLFPPGFSHSNTLRSHETVPLQEF